MIRTLMKAALLCGALALAVTPAYADTVQPAPASNDAGKLTKDTLATARESAGVIVMVTDQGAKCNGVTDDGLAIARADAFAKSQNAELTFPANVTCLIRTPYLVSTAHTHWRSRGGTTTLQIDPNAGYVTSPAGLTGTLAFSNNDDTLLDSIIFMGLAPPPRPPTHGWSWIIRPTSCSGAPRFRISARVPTSRDLSAE